MNDSDVPPLAFSKSRFESFSDGVFAVAITLLIVEVHLPASISAISSPSAQTAALLAMWPEYLIYAVSFVTIGIMWFNHHALVDRVQRVTYRMVVANLFLLGLVVFLPFATDVLARLGLSRPAVVCYGMTLTAISVGYLVLQRAVVAAHPGSGQKMTAWNFVGLTLYPLATVAGLFVPLLGVMLIAVLAIFYAHPRNVRMAQFTPSPNG